MNKADQRELNKVALFGSDVAGMARMLSMIHRGTSNKKTRAEVIAVALKMEVLDNPEFII
jgi:hypothetical protein